VTPGRWLSRQTSAGYDGAVQITGVYRSEQGMVWRVIEGEDGSLKVEVLNGEAWLPGRIGLVGLRLAPSTTKLNARAIRGLPA
jgi:hypothetical protein